MMALLMLQICGLHKQVPSQQTSPTEPERQAAYWKTYSHTSKSSLPLYMRTSMTCVTSDPAQGHIRGSLSTVLVNVSLLS